MDSMDIIRIWGNILANNNSVCSIMPTTYFMQGVQVFAYANESNESNSNLSSSSSTTSSASSSSSCNEYNDDAALRFSSRDTVETSQIDDTDDESQEQKSFRGKDENKGIKISKRIQIQRIRYSREEYKCSMCKYTCTTEKAFLKHLRRCENSRKDADEPRISCPICGKDRKDEQSIVVHMRKHKDDKHFCCDLCKFRTLQLKKLIQHRRMHTGEKPHLCPFCSYRSARRDNLRSHVRRVHKKDNLTCDTFTPRSMLLTPSKNA